MRGARLSMRWGWGRECGCWLTPEVSSTPNADILPTSAVAQQRHAGGGSHLFANGQRLAVKGHFIGSDVTRWG